MSFTHPHQHIFEPASEQGNSRVFLLLHGTGGNEHDLIPFARQLDPGAAIFGIRGNVTENGMPRFFKRLSEGVFDKADIVKRAKELGSFIKDSADKYDFHVSDVVAIGYSNGANIATALHFIMPGTVTKSIHLRPMTPLEPDEPIDLTGHQVFLSFGAFDQLTPRGEDEKLTQMFLDFNASVTKNVEPTGHQLVQHDLQAALEWIKNL